MSEQLSSEQIEKVVVEICEQYKEKDGYYYYPRDAFDSNDKHYAYELAEENPNLDGVIEEFYTHNDDYESSFTSDLVYEVKDKIEESLHVSVDLDTVYDCVDNFVTDNFNYNFNYKDLGNIPCYLTINNGDANTDYSRNKVFYNGLITAREEFFDEEGNERLPTREEVRKYYESDPELLSDIQKSGLGFLIKSQGYDPVGFLSDYYSGKKEFQSKFLTSLAHELNEMPETYCSAVTVCLDIPFEDMMKLKESMNTEESLKLIDRYNPQGYNGKSNLILSKGVSIGLFNEWDGCGALFEIELENDVVLPLNLIGQLHVDDRSVLGQYTYPPSDVFGDNLQRDNEGIVSMQLMNDEQIKNTFQSGCFIRPENKAELLELIDSVVLSDIDTSHITDMSNLFSSCEREDYSGIEHWDVSNVTDMSGMFEDCVVNVNLNQWNVSNVKDMHDMFAHAQFDTFAGDWNLSNVKNMDSMFEECVFNSSYWLNKWKDKVSNVESMVSMFEGSDNCKADLSEWNISKNCDTYCFAFNTEIPNEKLPKAYLDRLKTEGALDEEQQEDIEHEHVKEQEIASDNEQEPSFKI